MTLRLCLATAVALAALFAGAGAADAHASLVSSNPAPGAVLTAAPDAIELRFSEPVDLPPQAIRLFDAHRTEVDVGTARHGSTDAVVRATLPPLAEGGYVVTWRAVSADGHPVSAAFTFAVGRGSVGADVADALAQLEPSGASRTSGVLYGVARAVAYIALAAMLGTAFAGTFLWHGAFDDARSRALLLASSCVATIGSALVYGFHGVNARGGRAADLLRWVTWSDAASTQVGRWLIARTAVLLFASTLVWLVLRSRGATRTRIAQALLATGAVAIACVALSGHAATGRHTTLGFLADVVHVAALSVWIGGLSVLLVGVLRVANEDTARAVAARFSQLAFGCVVVLVATGTFMAWRQGVEATHPTETTYGRLLVVKVVVVALLVAVAAGSRRALHARAPGAAEAAHAPSRHWRATLRRTVAAEVALAIGVFAVTSLLVDAAPPRSSDVGPVEVRRSVAGLLVDAVIDPAEAGPTELHIYVSDATTQQPKVEEVTVNLTQPALGAAPIEVKMFRAGPAHFQSDNLVLPFAGTWTLTIGVRTDAFTRETVDASINIR